MTKFQDITVNGVTVRLYRLSAKQQHDIVNQYFFPITTQAGELVNVIIKNPQNQIAIASAIAEAVNKFMPAEKRDELIFKHLMPSVKVVAAGMEIEYCSPKGESLTILNVCTKSRTKLLNTTLKIFLQTGSTEIS